MTAPAMFDPAAVVIFKFGARHWDPATNTLKLHYSLDDTCHFTETITFPAIANPGVIDSPAWERAAEILHAIAGVSYFKAAFPLQVNTGSLRVTKMLARFLHDLYANGLAECAWRNELPRAPDLDFEVNTLPLPARGAGLGRRSLVPIGGGKDSIVAMEVVRRSGIEPLLVTTNEHPAKNDVARIAGLDMYTVRRQVDPELLELNNSGAYNGHVPVTAINSAITVLVALATGCDEIVMANERSASEGSFEWNGAMINHQYSKAYEFEKAFNGLIRSEIASDLNYFSIFRNWSELQIAREFAALKQYHGAFLSCNQAYTKKGRGSRWCGNCDKCRFVTLILAPWLSPAELMEMTGHDLLNSPEQLEGFRTLLALNGPKPLDCVGEVNESRFALSLVARRPEWSGHFVVRALQEELPGISQNGDQEFLQPHGEELMPERYSLLLNAPL